MIILSISPYVHHFESELDPQFLHQCFIIEPVELEIAGFG
jgi:hypothetical protein